MSRLYGDSHRTLQDQFDTRPLADRIESIAASTAIGASERAFIESLDMFFLSSIDHQGRPTVSYKGGDAGFVRVIDATTVAFPSYDGNGMFLSMGNIAANPQVGLLFISFERPHRLRLQGRASVAADDPLIDAWPEAQLVVRVAVEDVWQNCPRYVHRFSDKSTSRYVPRAGEETPMAEWKRIEAVQDVLSPQEAERARQLGHVDPVEWAERIARGDPQV